ncbi:nucleotide pyrophosphohydrolase [Neptuniibacter sp. QD37_6]|uniref:nucleotide pyrophosphohydrolase n=1 Tax=Neptuniibacter sp. QD37_6 TaxID=3398210 RepID=UPI0039F4EB0A
MKTNVVSELDELKESLRLFSAERDWDKFHSPKNLAMALAVEASEIMEHFQWLSESESANLDSRKSKAVSEELADVFLYLIRLSDKLNIDLVSAANDKLEINKTKYPVELVKGKSEKYTEYLRDDKK